MSGVIVFFSFCWLCVRIATCFECHCTTFRSALNIVMMVRSMKGVHSRMFTAMFGVMTKHARLQKATKRSCGRSSLSIFIGCLVAVVNIGWFARFIRFFQFGCIKKKVLRFTPDLVSRIGVAMCMAFTSIPFVIWHCYVAFAVKAMSDFAEVICKGFDINTEEQRFMRRGRLVCGKVNEVKKSAHLGNLSGFVGLSCGFCTISSYMDDRAEGLF